MKTLLSLILLFIPLFALADSDAQSKLTAHEDTVDLVIINHFLDEKGRIVFDQIIFLDHNEYQSRYLVRDWRLIKDGRKNYTAEEIQVKRKEARDKWFEEQKFNTAAKEYYNEVCVWNPEYGYSKTLNIDHQNKCVTWQDGEFLRKVRWTDGFHHTTTQEDPELLDRDLFPKDSRAKLRTRHIKFSPPESWFHAITTPPTIEWFSE